MPVTQLVYVSRPFGFDDLALMTILDKALRNNVRDAITGSLICREDMYLQLLEGPRAPVRAAFERIMKDGRHTDVREVCTLDVAARLFPDWAMRHDPAHSWMWSRAEVSAGAADRATTHDVLAIFTRLAAQPPETPQRCPMGHGA